MTAGEREKRAPFKYLNDRFEFKSLIRSINLAEYAPRDFPHGLPILIGLVVGSEGDTFLAVGS